MVRERREPLPRPAVRVDGQELGAHGVGALDDGGSGRRPGEVVTVAGTGLIGRRPMPQPGESFEHLVQIVDRGLSVSKTHVEFGEHDGGLWVADRFSSNGTVVRRPGEGGLRCEPGRRVLVPRGSRVEIGEQAFTVA